MKTDESHFRIDRFRLDDEWVRQPDLYRQYALALADAKLKLESAKNELSVARSEVELAIRNDPEAWDLTKTTEALIKTVADSAVEVVQAQKDVANARHEVGVLEAACGALDHKKRALSDLVALHLSDYYSKPVVEDDEALREASKRRTRRSQRRRGDD